MAVGAGVAEVDAGALAVAAAVVGTDPAAAGLFVAPNNVQPATKPASENPAIASLSRVWRSLARPRLGAVMAFLSRTVWPAGGIR